MNIIKWDGQPITAPGVYSGVTMDAYHGILTDSPSASRSQLWKLIDKSPAHLWLTHYLNPNREEVAENKPLLFGRAAHHLILGEADFRKHFTIRPETYPEDATYPSMDGKLKPWSGNSLWCKAWLKDFKSRGFDILTKADLESVEGMAGGLGAHPMVRAGILNGLIEHTMVAKHAATGIWMKVRPDAIPTDSGDVSDFKTIADISDEGIERAIGDNGLAMQGGMTRMVMRELGLPFTSFSLVFSEKDAPYCARVKTLTDGDLDLGEQSVETSIRMYAQCIKRGSWPGPGGDQTDAEYAQMTPWARRKIEHRLEQMEKELSL